MVNHIVAWNIVDSLKGDERTETKLHIKSLLEDLKEKIPEIHSLKVEIEPYDSSNREVVLISVFKTKQDLDVYQVHTDHVNAGSYIKTVTCDRICLDYES